MLVSLFAAVIECVALFKKFLHDCLLDPVPR